MNVGREADRDQDSGSLCQPGTGWSGLDSSVVAVSGRGARKPIPPKLYRIGEVAEYSGVSRQTIHNYTTMGLIREAQWTRGGHRLYDETVFGRLDAIEELKAQNKTMEHIREEFSRQYGLS